MGKIGGCQGMKAVVCTQLGDPAAIEIRDMPVPAPGPGEVLVRHEAWGVNYVDLLMSQGGYQLRPDPPYVMGLEAAGVVTAVGSAVDGFSEGDRVMVSHRPGAFAEVTLAPPARVIRIPDEMDFESAAGFRSAFSTAIHALVQGGRLQPGETALIHGAAGGTGHAAVQVAKCLGATVIATATGAEKLAALKQMGADHAIGYREGFRDAVKAITGGRGVDVVFDPIGGDVFDETMRCLNWGARIVVVGFAGGRPALAKTNHVLIKGASVVGIRAGEFGRRHPEASRANMERLLGWAAAGKLRTYISHRFPLDGIADALRAVGERRVIGKAVLVRSL